MIGCDLGDSDTELPLNWIAADGRDAATGLTGPDGAPSPAIAATWQATSPA